MKCSAYIFLHWVYIYTELRPYVFVYLHQITLIKGKYE